MSGQAPNPGDLPSITSDEINAAFGLQDITAQVAACTNPERALRVLENHSSPRNKMSTVQASQSQAASFGTALAIKFGANNYRAVPAGLLMEAIPDLASDLATKAMQLDRSVTRHWDTTVFQTVDRALCGSRKPCAPRAQLPQSPSRIRCIVLAATGAPRRLDRISHRRQVATSLRLSTESPIRVPERRDPTSEPARTDKRATRCRNRGVTNRVLPEITAATGNKISRCVYDDAAGPAVDLQIH